MKRIRFIINPIAGTHSKASMKNKLDKLMDKEEVVWDIAYTQNAGHAVELAAKSAEEKIDIVVAVGGDGTVNEVARSLIHTDTALAILPSGSGNGLARHLQIPMEYRKALDVIKESVIETKDYGKINGIPFFCTCGVGFDAFVSMKFAEAGKRGMLTYLEKMLQEVLNYKPETYELETEDGTERYKAFLITCANASQYGNNAYIAPRATMTDGLLDVTILEPFTVLDIPSLAFQLFNKTIDQNSRIKTFRCENLTIRRNAPGVVHYDGDPVMTGKDIEIKIVKKGLKVVVPKNKEKTTFNILNVAFEYISEIKALNGSIVDDLARKNKSIMNKNKKIIRKLTGRNRA